MDYRNYILEFKANNHQNFKSFYDLTNKQIYLTSIAILKDRDEALDIVQDTYLNFLKNINNIDESKFHEGYLIRIARNLSINRYKQKQREFVNNDVIDNQKEEKDILELEKVKAILRHLDDDVSREIIVYHLIFEYKFKDIAKIIDKPLGTILWIYNKAIKILKERVKL